MILPFEQIDVSFADLNFDALMETESHFNNGPKTFFQYNLLENSNFQKIVDKKIHFEIKPDKINITKIIYPGIGIHTDQWKTALNYFITGSDDITSFFLPEKILKTKFQQGNTYLLNTQCRHSVKINDPNAVRLILRFMWIDKEFEEIKKSIAIQ
jgi:hypothetical protein